MIFVRATKEMIVGISYIDSQACLRSFEAFKKLDFQLNFKKQFQTINDINSS